MPCAPVRPTGEPFDVLVVGGGITGVGVALDAANRGLRTALVERDDFASGTSSKSSKLVHGGLRYLQNGDVRLVYEALHERRRLMRNAPHMVEVLPFLIPIMTKDGVISRKVAKALGSALWMYDLTGGWRIGKLHRRLSAEQAAAHFPSTHLDKLSGGFLYYDATADDARLTLTIARTAAAHGAVLANRCRLVELAHDDGRVVAAVVEADGERLRPSPTRSVVNATGVWADDVRALDEGTHPDSIRPAKGVHITLPWSLVRNDIAVIIPVRRDKRSLFLVPWGAARGRHVPARLCWARPTPISTGRWTIRRPTATTSTTSSRRSTRRSTRRRPTARSTSPAPTSPACGRGSDHSSNRRSRAERRPRRISRAATTMSVSATPASSR